MWNGIAALGDVIAWRFRWMPFRVKHYHPLHNNNALADAYLGGSKTQSATVGGAREAVPHLTHDCAQFIIGLIFKVHRLGYALEQGVWVY